MPLLSPDVTFIYHKFIKKSKLQKKVILLHSAIEFLIELVYYNSLLLLFIEFWLDSLNERHKVIPLVVFNDEGTFSCEYSISSVPAVRVWSRIVLLHSSQENCCHLYAIKK